MQKSINSKYDPLKTLSFRYKLNCPDITPGLDVQTMITYVLVISGRVKSSAFLPLPKILFTLVYLHSVNASLS